MSISKLAVAARLLSGQPIINAGTKFFFLDDGLDVAKRFVDVKTFDMLHDAGALAVKDHTFHSVQYIMNPKAESLVINLLGVSVR